MSDYGVVKVLGDTTIDGDHCYGWYLDENGNRVDFDNCPHCIGQRVDPMAPDCPWHDCRDNVTDFDDGWDTG